MVIENLIYVIGGHDEAVNKIEVFNITMNKWHECSPMNTWRFDVGIAELDGSIFAVGGFFGSEYSDVVERYDPNADLWETVIFI